jgi:hypothetical protein
MVGGMVLEITPSGQNSQQLKQAGLFRLAGMHFVRSMTGRLTRHEPVLPPSPGPGSLWDFRQAKGAFFVTGFMTGLQAGCFQR